MDTEAFDFMRAKYENFPPAATQHHIHFHPAGTNIKAEYHIGKRIDGSNRSSFSQVRICTERSTGVKKAVKTYSLENSYFEASIPDVILAGNSGIKFSAILSEIEALSTLKHINIVKLYEIYFDSRYIHLVMELYRGGELFELIYLDDELSADDAYSTFMQLLNALKYMNSMGFCHRGLCVENIMYSEKDLEIVKIIGFSSVGKIGKMNFKEMYGSTMYMAPEVFGKNYDSSCDVWSLGVILYTMLVGFQPFQDDNEKKLIKKIKKTRFAKPPNWKKLNPKSKSLLKSIFRRKERPTIDEITLSQAVAHYNFKKQVTSIKIIDISERHHDEWHSENQLKLGSHLKLILYRILESEGFYVPSESLESVWSQLDPDSIGSVVDSELTNKLYEIFEDPRVTDDIPKVLKHLDIMGKGKVSKEEFISALMQTPSDEDIFKALATIGITEEVEASVQQFGKYLQESHEEIEALILSCFNKSTITREEVIFIL